MLATIKFWPKITIPRMNKNSPQTILFYNIKYTTRFQKVGLMFQDQIIITKILVNVNEEDKMKKQ